MEDSELARIIKINNIEYIYINNRTKYPLDIIIKRNNNYIKFLSGSEHCELCNKTIECFIKNNLLHNNDILKPSLIIKTINDVNSLELAFEYRYQDGLSIEHKNIKAIVGINYNKLNANRNLNLKKGLNQNHYFTKLTGEDRVNLYDKNWMKIKKIHTKFLSIITPLN